MGIWSRTYVCCAIPLYNSGIYLIMVQFAVVALLTGILSFTAPHIVAVSIPSIAPIIFGIVCILVAVAQAVGFLGVYREKPNLFKLYARVNAGLVALALVLAIIFIGVSAGNHKPALAKCITLFTTQANMNGTTSSTISGTKFQNASVSTGTAICNVWTWVQLGIMGLLFIIVALTEAYFLMYQNIYASEQRLDHARYDSVYSTAAEEIRQSGLWESTSLANGGGGAGGGASSLGHGRASSELSRPQLYSDNVRAPSAGSGLRNEIGMEGENEKYAGDGRFTPPVNGGYGYDNGGTSSSNGFYSTPQQQSQNVSPSKRGMNSSSVPIGGVYNSSAGYQPSVTGSNHGSNSGGAVGGERSASKMSNRSQYNQQTSNTYPSSSSSYIPHSQSSYAQQQPASASPMAALGYQDPYGGVSNSPLVQPSHQQQSSSNGGRRTPTENNYGGRSNTNSRMGNNTPTNMNNNNNNNINQGRTSSDIGGGYQGGYGQVQNVQQQSQQEYRGNSPSRKQLPRQPSDRGQQDGYY